MSSFSLRLKSVESVEIPSKPGVSTERGNPRADVKGVYQVEEPQDKSTDAVMGADPVVVVKKYL